MPCANSGARTAYNFAWGGDGKDLFALMGTNNNVWGGKGDDVVDDSLINF
jgi:hypothetical protein